MIFVIISVVIIITALILILSRLGRVGYYKLQDAWLVQEFSRCNVIVFGKKGTGKDLLFAHVIHLRGDKHYANMPYNDNTEVVDLKEVALGDNTFIDLVEDTIKRFKPRFDAGKDIYISDAGVVLPGQEDRTLDKRYPSMPLLYALSRQTYQNNIHINSQALSRPWKKLREQADSYIRVLGNTPKKKYIIVKAISYEQYAAAEKGLLPCNDKQFTATNGEIKYRRFKIYIKELKYDTYFFASKFFEEVDDSCPIPAGMQNIEGVQNE